MGQIQSVQYLRAAAALMVVIYHATRWTPWRLDVGAAGVDVFFIISGFILWTVAAERPVTVDTFLARRWVRVAPLYWLLTLLVAAMAALWPSLIWDAKPTLSHVLLSLAFVQHLNPDSEPFPIITAGWSLNYEAIFYVIFAAGLLAPERRRLAAISIGLLAVPAFGIFIFPPAYYLGANMMFLQFIAGVWLAHWRLKRSIAGRGEGWLMVVAGVLTFAALQLSGFYDNLWRPILWGVPAFLLVAGLVTVEARGGLPTLGWLKLIGNASYSIYLIHFVAMQLLTHVLDSGRFWPFVPVAIAVSVAVGVLCYRLIECPLIALFRRRKLGLLPSQAT